MIASPFPNLDLYVRHMTHFLNCSVSFALDQRKKEIKIATSQSKQVVTQHRILIKIKNFPKAEAFGQAGLLDLISGYIRFNVPKSIIVDTERRYPRLGFTEKVLKKSVKWSFQHPLNPFQMMKFELPGQN